MILTLSNLIAHVESEANPWAVRFEPAHKPASQWVEKMRSIVKCSGYTAQVLCACSWGMFQEMGDNLMAAGLTVSPMQFCADTSMQNTYFARFVEEDKVNFSLDEILSCTPKRLLFARMYNGPGNVDAYAQRMIDTYAHFKG